MVKGQYGEEDDIVNIDNYILKAIEGLCHMALEISEEGTQPCGRRAYT
jgi:hypothetical protein